MSRLSTKDEGGGPGHPATAQNTEKLSRHKSVVCAAETREVEGVDTVVTALWAPCETADSLPYNRQTGTALTMS